MPFASRGSGFESPQLHLKLQIRGMIVSPDDQIQDRLTVTRPSSKSAIGHGRLQPVRSGTRFRESPSPLNTVIASCWVSVWGRSVLHRRSDATWFEDQPDRRPVRRPLAADSISSSLGRAKSVVLEDPSPPFPVWLAACTASELTAGTVTCGLAG